jgi:hypothetical protein
MKGRGGGEKGEECRPVSPLVSVVSVALKASGRFALSGRGEYSFHLSFKSLLYTSQTKNARSREAARKSNRETYSLGQLCLAFLRENLLLYWLGRHLLLPAKIGEGQTNTNNGDLTK